MKECGYIKDNNIWNKNICKQNEIALPPPKDTKYLKKKKTKLNENSSLNTNLKLSKNEKIGYINLLTIIY